MHLDRVRHSIGLCVFLSLCLGVLSVELLSGFGCLTWNADNFKVYDVTDVPVNHTVKLTDQFAEQAKEARLVALTHFANPVDRVIGGDMDTPIINEDWHLTWYRLQQEQREPRRTVEFKNSFGEQRVDVEEPRYMLAPTQKLLDPDSVFPTGLDHYKCYEVVHVHPPGPERETFDLADQFGLQQQVVLDNAVLFCNPAKKERDGEEPAEIKRPTIHLAVYTVTPQVYERDFNIHDQFFNAQRIHTTRSLYLAVPSVKERFETHER